MAKPFVTVIVVVTLALVPAVEAQDRCRIATAENPRLNYSINPNVTYKWNPDVTYSINPNVTYSINPRVTYRYNPNVTYSINPNVTPRLNPAKGRWDGFYVCTPDGELIAASVIANEDVILLFTGGEWIGHFVTNKKGGFNFFNRDNKWKGFLVPMETAGFAFFNRDKEWVLSLKKCAINGLTSVWCALRGSDDSRWKSGRGHCQTCLPAGREPRSRLPLLLGDWKCEAEYPSEKEVQASRPYHERNSFGRFRTGAAAPTCAPRKGTKGEPSVSAIVNGREEAT